ncbi:hypothetical protein [Mycobacteroides abscessus]|uniref:hypothetical protein n=1 Tax=Mycobacteroides abscessus TaxID=36809 RepID=UPI0012FEF4C1|nr:hypothetical protein [Mycobacteroides abscessus]
MAFLITFWLVLSAFITLPIFINFWLITEDWWDGVAARSETLACTMFVASLLPVFVGIMAVWPFIIGRKILTELRESSVQKGR